MIELGDKNNRGYVDLDGFMNLMREIGLIKDQEQPTDLDKEYTKALEGRNGRRGHSAKSRSVKF